MPRSPMPGGTAARHGAGTPLVGAGRSGAAGQLGATPAPVRRVRWCQYCGRRRAEIYDLDGCWCCPEHRVADRLG